MGISALVIAVINVPAKVNSSHARLNELPLVISEFSGRELPVEQSVKDILETPNVLMREYLGPDGLRIILSIVYYDRYRVAFHLPEGCMTGQGSVIVKSLREPVTAPGAEEPFIANRLVLEQPEGKEHVFYFFIAGDLITASYPRMRLHLMMEHVKRRPTGAALVRFSAKTRERDEEILESLSDFIEQMVPVLRSHLG
jgi:EpsI family protein